MQQANKMIYFLAWADKNLTLSFTTTKQNKSWWKRSTGRTLKTFSITETHKKSKLRFPRSGRATPVTTWSLRVRKRQSAWNCRKEREGTRPDGCWSCCHRTVRSTSISRPRTKCITSSAVEIWFELRWQCCADKNVSGDLYRSRYIVYLINIMKLVQFF